MHCRTNFDSSTHGFVSFGRTKHLVQGANALGRAKETREPLGIRAEILKEAMFGNEIVWESNRPADLTRKLKQIE